MAKKVLGLTGGIASGKSTIAKHFVSLGVAVVDADQVARDVVTKGSPGLAAVIDAFGSEYLDGEGELDRGKLGARIFGDEDARKMLNGIVHPRVAQEARRQLVVLQQSDAPYIIYEVPLLVENGLHRVFSPVVVVAVKPETQLARLMKRDGSNEEAASARIASQMPLEEKLKVADHVIWNDGGPSEAKAAVEALHAKLLEEVSQ